VWRVILGRGGTNLITYAGTTVPEKCSSDAFKNALDGQRTRPATTKGAHTHQCLEYPGFEQDWRPGCLMQLRGDVRHVRVGLLPWRDTCQRPQSSTLAFARTLEAPTWYVCIAQERGNLSVALSLANTAPALTEVRGTSQLHGAPLSVLP